MPAFLPILLISALFPFHVLARGDGDPIAWLSQRPEVGERIMWSYGEEVVIEGANLKGAYSKKDGFPAARELCFNGEANASDVRCFDPDDPAIKEWTQNSIIATIPEDAPSRGSVSLRFEVKKEECKSLLGFGIIGFGCGKNAKWGDDLVVGHYDLSPEITDVIDPEGNPTDVLVAGKKYEIRGHWFGTQRGFVRIDGKPTYPMDILRWSPTNVVMRPSSSGTRVEVHNGHKYTKAIVLRKELPRRRSRSLHTRRKVSLPVRIRAALIPFLDRN